MESAALITGSSHLTTHSELPSLLEICSLHSQILSLPWPLKLWAIMRNNLPLY